MRAGRHGDADAVGGEQAATAKAEEQDESCVGAVEHWQAELPAEAEALAIQSRPHGKRGFD